MEQHSFNVEIATMYGIAPAILLNNLYFWIKKNKANKVNYYDGYYWTYNSKNAFAELFPYMNARQIDYALKKLIDAGLIITGHYNETAYDRTLWYAITKKGYCILQKCEMEETNLQNGNNKIVEPIPYINTDNKPNIIPPYVDNQNILSNQWGGQKVDKCPPDIDKEKDIDKDNIIYIVDFLNSTLNTRYRSQTQTTQKLIKARLNEGFTVDDFKTVIKKKADEWKGTEMAVFLRPETLFGAKFESYLNAPKKTKGSSNKTEHFENEREYSEKECNNLLKDIDDINF